MIAEGRIVVSTLVLMVLASSRPGIIHAQDSLARIAPAADTTPQFTLETRPGPFTEGTVLWLRVRPLSGSVVVGGQLADEPLHFEPTESGYYRTLAGVPLEADSVRLGIFLSRNERVDTVIMPIAVRQTSYPAERILVAPAFVKPDSATSVRIQAEFARSREVSRRAQETPRLWRGAFQLPRSSRITSAFGTARVYNGEIKSRHLGTDFAGAVGAPVRASGRGVVALVGNFYLAGRAVYLNHGAGLVTAYFHLSRVNVAQGDTVTRGEIIGRVGQSGRVTGPHLHWVARYGAISLDPLSLLKLEKTEKPAARPETAKGPSKKSQSPPDSARGQPGS